jgi:hypothetical protein
MSLLKPSKTLRATSFTHVLVVDISLLTIRIEILEDQYQHDAVAVSVPLD